MPKLTLSDLTNLQNEVTAVTSINANSALIETALENTLSRDGTSPNTMEAQLDMNSNTIINLPEPTLDAHPTTKAYVDALVSNPDIDALTEELSIEPTADFLIIYDVSAGANRKVHPDNLGITGSGGGGGGSGETNTASNVGTAGVGVFKQKTGTNLEFKNINAASAKITVTDDTGNNEVDIDLGSVASTDLSDSASLATLSGTQTLTNKTVNLTSNTLSGTTAQFNTALSDGDFATLTGAETLTTKSIDLGSNTITGTVAQFNTALTDNDFTTISGTETLTNKSLDADNNTITNVGSSEITGDIVTGLTEELVPTGGDFLLGFDTTAGALRKFNVGNLPTGGGGESNTASNVGTGDAEVFKQKSGINLEFRELIGGTNVTLTQAADTITIDAAGGGGLSDGDFGDITISGGGTVFTIDPDTVTYDKMQDTSGTNVLLGRSSAGGGTVEEVTCTAAGRALIDDADATAQRTTLGLGALATLASVDNSNFSGTDLAVVNGGTGASDAATARANLGLAIGTDVLAQQTIGIADNNLLEVDGTPVVGEYARFTANGLEGRTEAEFKTDFNLEIGVDVQAFNANAAFLNVAQEWSQAQNFNETALTDGSTINWDAAANQVAVVTLGGNRTMAAPTNIPAGRFIAIRVIQDGTGSRTLSWNTVFKWPGGTAPTLTTTASGVDLFTFWSDGTNLHSVGQSLDSQ